MRDPTVAVLSCRWPRVQSLTRSVCPELEAASSRCASPFASSPCRRRERRRPPSLHDPCAPRSSPPLLASSFASPDDRGVTPSIFPSRSDRERVETTCSCPFALAPTSRRAVARCSSARGRGRLRPQRRRIRRPRRAYRPRPPAASARRRAWRPRRPLVVPPERGPHDALDRSAAPRWGTRHLRTEAPSASRASNEPRGSSGSPRPTRTAAPGRVPTSHAALGDRVRPASRPRSPRTEAIWRCHPDRPSGEPDPSRGRTPRPVLSPDRPSTKAA